jgi:hypothetical protein
MSIPICLTRSQSVPLIFNTDRLFCLWPVPREQSTSCVVILLLLTEPAVQVRWHYCRSQQPECHIGSKKRCRQVIVVQEYWFILYASATQDVSDSLNCTSTDIVED